MKLKYFGYACCLSCSFNFIMFQVLFVHLKFGKRSVELTPELVPTASHACMTCGILNLAIVVVTLCYLKGVIKFNPLHYVMRVFNMAGRHGPATGSGRYRRFTDSLYDMQHTPNSANEYEQVLSPNRESSAHQFDPKVSVLLSQQQQTMAPPPPPSMAQSNSSMEVNMNNSSNAGTEGGNSNTFDNKPPFEMIDLS